MADVTLTPTLERPAPPMLIQAAVVATGLTILMVRPTVIGVLGWAAPEVVGLFSLVLAIGLVAPLDQASVRLRSSAATSIPVFGAGASVFVIGRILSAGHSPAHATVLLIALNTLASVAEEALFRRTAFALLLPAGPAVAIAGSALLFGLAHVTVYGWWAFPVDVAAGVVLGWQRWASGTWLVPAATHALADLLVVI